MFKELLCCLFFLSSAAAFEDPFAFFPRPKRHAPTPIKKPGQERVKEKKQHVVKEDKVQPVQDNFSVQPLPIHLEYSNEKERPISIDRLMKSVRIPLSRGKSGYRGPQKGVKRLYMTLDEINALPRDTLFYTSALHAISEAVSHAIYEEKGYIGVFCTADNEKLREIAIDRGEAKRQKKRGRRVPTLPRTARPGLDFQIEISTCGSIRTVSTEKGVEEGAIDSVRTAFIRRNTPVKKGSSLKKSELSDYALYLSRYPDRRVDIEFHPLERMEEIGIDYNVDSTRPWHIYASVSNTGTAAIGRWVESFGFIHNQALIRDAQAKIEYATAEFNNYHTVRASYEFPLFKVPRTRFRAHFAYMRYSSTQLGVKGPAFTGRQSGGGGTFLSNLYQRGTLFLDAEAGLTYRAVRIVNHLASTDSNYVQYFLPRFGLSLEKRERAWSFAASAACNTTINGFMVGDSHANISRLGSPGVTNPWFYFDGSLSTSLFIDSLTRPEKGPFAHEIRFIGAGQVTPRAFRLVPQFKGVVGGLHSVRGYPESFTSGDTTAVLSGEYLIHIPRLFHPRKQPSSKIFGKPFYVAPPRPGLLPSWDLAFKLFVDSGGAYTNRKQGERDAFLLSVGTGLDLNLMNHLIVRTDFGVALKGAVGTAVIERGHTRFSLSATLYY